MSRFKNRTAGEGQIFVCGACGKRSRDRFGDRAVDEGWDESCMLNAILCYESSLRFGKDGKVIEAVAVFAG